MVIMKDCKLFKSQYLSYSFETGKGNLSNDVIEVCNMLKKDLIVIEVFSKDTLNDILLSNSLFISQYGNFNYYVCNQIEFFNFISFIDVRYIGIYSIEELPLPINNKSLNNNYAFFICFENYLDTSHLRVCRKYYPDSMKKDLNELKHIIKKCFW